MKKLQVLGPGCPKCEKLAANVDQAAASLGIEYELVKVRDVLLFPAMKPEVPREELAPVCAPDSKCKKCGNENLIELKSAKKGKGMFCIDVAACKQRVQEKQK